MSPGRCCALLLLLVACSKAQPSSTDAGTADAGQQKPDAGAPVCTHSFQHEQGFPCNSDQDCTTGHCFFPLDTATNTPVAGFCTVTCDVNATTNSCPTNYDCVPDPVSDSGDCAPYGNTLPGDHTLPLGSPCVNDADCASQKCGGLDNMDGTLTTFCTESCTKDSECGTCSACAPSADGNRCQPAGSKAIGEQCSSRFDCASFDCIGFCTQECGGPNGIECPGNAVCTPLTQNGRRITICVDPSQKGTTPPNGPCSFDFQCQDGATCASPAEGMPSVCTPVQALGGACKVDSDCSGGLVCRSLSSDITVCTKGCDPDCGGGNTCVAIDMDTSLKLYSEVNGQYQLVMANDDIDPTSNDRWSAITNWSLDTGTYWVEAKVYGQYTGAYQLALLTGTDAPAMVTEQSNPHGAFDSAQSIASLPALVTGTFSAVHEVDYYKFTLAAPATVTLQTQRGAPSLCFPTANIGKKKIGDLCSADFLCAGGLCEGSLGKCGQSCKTDVDCGSDNKCADLETHLSCVTSQDYRGTQAGGDCHFNWECFGDKGFCATRHGSKFCSQTCSGPTDPCAILADPHMQSPNECVPFTTPKADGTTESDYACVPAGTRMGAAGTTCEVNSDCLTSLTCMNGKCG